jgi:hypothetical protein
MPSAANVHLLLNHVPILGTLFCLLGLAYGALRRSDEVTRASLLALVLVALLTVPAYLSGEGAERAVRPLTGIGVSTVVMDAHEAAALPALLAVEGVGVLALLALVIGRGQRSVPPWVRFGVIAGAAIAFALAARAAALGGRVHHPELR